MRRRRESRHHAGSSLVWARCFYDSAEGWTRFNRPCMGSPAWWERLFRRTAAQSRRLPNRRWRRIWVRADEVLATGVDRLHVVWRAIRAGLPPVASSVLALDKRDGGDP